MNFDWNVIWTHRQALLEGAAMTIGLTVVTMLLAVPPEVVAAYPPRVQQLLGYNIHPPFMGHVNGMHPLKALTPHLKAHHES